MFSQVVTLYRALGLPKVNGGVFEYRGEVSPETLAVVIEVNEISDKYGFFKEFGISGNSVEIEYSLPATGDHGRFHDSLEAFIKATPSLSRGLSPKDFYICDMNFYSGDDLIPLPIQRLRDVCEFIHLLSKLASQSVQEGEHEKNHLTFILVADGKSPAKTLELAPNVNTAMLGTPLRHLNVLRALLSDAKKNNIHIEERKAIMRLAVAEVIDSAVEKTNIFEALVLKWNDVLLKYRHNVLAFIHQFSFEKIRKEIATAQIDYATKLSGVLGDIAGKFLALPISFAGFLLLRKTTDSGEIVIYSMGFFVITITMIGVLVNQWLQVRRLDESFQMVFSQYDDKLPAKLQIPIAKAKSSLGFQSRVLMATFSVFIVIALIPAVGALYYLYPLLRPYLQPYFP